MGSIPNEQHPNKPSRGSPQFHTGLGGRSLPPGIKHLGTRCFPRGSAARTQNLPGDHTTTLMLTHFEKVRETFSE